MATWTVLPLVSMLCVTLVSSQMVDPALQDLVNRNTDFAARLYQSVSSRSDSNVFLSPLALSIALAAVVNLTDGTSRDQLMQGLDLRGLEPGGLPDLFQGLRASVLQGGVASSLSQGVAVLPAPDFQVTSSYADLVQTRFGGTARTVDYSQPREAMDTINRWAQDQTGDQVQELVGDVRPQTQLMLATAASYRARFSPPFNASLTQDERFYVNRYRVVMVPMMFRADKYFLAYDPTVKVGVLKLPMADGAAMLVLLPDEDVDVGSVEEEVNGQKIRFWISKLKKTKLEVQLPRFLLEHSYSLRDVLQTLGITQLFQDEAGIDMGGAKGPVLSQVIQKSMASVDETSDDISTGGGVFSTLPPRLTINRPFIFLIYHEASGALMLIGRVTDPTKK